MPVLQYHEGTAGTGSGATATHAANTNLQHFVTRIAGHTDLDCLIQIRDNEQVIWEVAKDVSTGCDFSYDVDVIPITPLNKVDVVISASTSDCFASITGFSMHTGSAVK
jgi:hypothetical protein